MKEIPLTQGQIALVDDCDYEWLSVWKWFAHWKPHGHAFYAKHNIPTGLKYPPQRALRMHNVIWERHNGPIPDGLEIDHINRNTLDNRLSNLRLATRLQQMLNQRLRSTNTSGYRGVNWRKERGTWRARIIIDGKRVHLGYFTDPIEAALAYDAAARIHHGEFAQLNFPAEHLTNA